MKSIFQALNVRPEEKTQVVLMLATGFFMGIFIATYQVTSESLFLNSLSDQLDKAFLVSGIFGIVSTALFSFLQNRIKFSTLTTSSILSIVIATSAVYLLYNYGGDRYHDLVLFVMYCLAGPMTAVLLLCYWGIFGRLFNFRQSKRIIGWIDTGQLVAAILAFFLIPLTANYFLETSNYLIVCNISILLAAVSFFSISFRFPLTKNDPKEFEAGVRKETSFGKIFKDPYVLLLSVFLVISMVTFIFNQFAFQDLINKQYPDERELTNFLAYFNGAVYLFSLLMQTFVNDKIISNYGIRVSLFLLPVIVGVFALGGLFTGIFFGYDIVDSPTTFIFFFLFIALTRLFNATLRDSLENPVFKLLFIPLDNRYRFGIQAKVEGVVNESGRFLAGVIIFLLALVPFFEIVWIPAMILILVVGYFIITRKLYNGYKNKIRAKLETSDFTQDKLDIGFTQITNRLQDFLAGDGSSKAIFSFKLLEKINPAQISTWINSLMKNSDEEAREYAQRRMNELKGLSVSERYVIKMNAQKATALDKKVLTKNDLEQIITSGGDITKARLRQLTRSTSMEDRQYAAELLLHSSSEENISFLIELLHDPEPKVRSTAIKTSTQKFNNDVILALIDNLGSPIYGSQAMSALVLIGGKALNFLDSSFYRSGHSAQVLQRIIQVIGRIGGQQAKNILWSKIDYPDKVVVSQVVLSLGVCGFKAGVTQISRIKYAIESDIADISWNLNAIQEVGSSGDAKMIGQALEREIQNDIEHIYMLLAMLYDTRSIQLVKENIESGTTEGTTYAVELLDVFLSEQLKMRVIPVLDDLSISDKIAKLEVFYPRAKLDAKLVLKFLINRDFTQSNRWTKALVLHQIGIMKIGDFKLDLIAQLFNSDILIRETAAWALHEIDQNEYRDNSERLGEEIKRRLDEVIMPNQNQTRQMVFTKVMFFKEIEVFEGMAGVVLSYLADIAMEVQMKEGESLIIDSTVNNDFYIVFSGSVDFFAKGNLTGTFNRGQFIGEMISSPGFVNSNVVVAKEKTILLKINKDQFYELLSDNVRLADRVLEYI
ncbi:MAG: cyclic nucleotide-binding domain-containing protein [Cyclobacteriaceae bacterium]